MLCAPLPESFIRAVPDAGRARGASLMGPAFPWETLVANVVGAALMGLLTGLFAAKSIDNAELRLFATTGILGGFTT